MTWNLEEAIAHYRRQGAPADQAALIALLKEIQREEGGISPLARNAIMDTYGVKEGLLLALVKRIPSLRLSEIHTLELCAGANCPRRADLAGFVEKTYGAHPRGFTWKQIPCMRQCGQGPNLRWDGTLYNRADEALIRKLTESIKR